MLPAPPFVLLEDRVSPQAGGWLYAGAVEIHTCRSLDDVGATLAAAEQSVARGLHLAGWLAYDCAAAFEPAFGRSSDAPAGPPLIWLGAFECCEMITAAAIDAFMARRAPTAAVTNLRVGADRDTHTQRIRRALELIRAGDLYQVNLTFPLRFDYDGDPTALYAALRAGQAVAHGGLIATGETSILSVSPELFVDVTDGRATTRPMKGTAPRGDDAASDAAILAGLRTDPKQRAENLMIVDLLRNDLARVCRPGSVEVTELFTPETYATLHTLTSTVRGELSPDVGLSALMVALFPCGSVVGAPKIRAGQVIAGLETARRGVYTGAIGAMGPAGDLRFNVAIRTAVLERGRGVYGVGGGVVADSDPDSEYDEALLKGRLITELADDFHLIETFGWSGDAFVELDRHLARLGRSATILKFRFDAGALRTDLADAARAWDGERRVRIQLHRSGDTRISAEKTAARDGRPVRVVVARDRLDAADPFLRHKTSRRRAYVTALEWAQAQGADEAVLLNRAGRVADATRASIFLRKGGVLVTPPIEDGALPGVLRERMLERGEAQVSPIEAGELAGAELFVGSSLRGLRRAQLLWSDGP